MYLFQQAWGRKGSHLLDRVPRLLGQLKVQAHSRRFPRMPQVLVEQLEVAGALLRDVFDVSPCELPCLHPLPAKAFLQCGEAGVLNGDDVMMALRWMVHSCSLRAFGPLAKDWGDRLVV